MKGGDDNENYNI